MVRRERPGSYKIVALEEKEAIHGIHKLCDRITLELFRQKYPLKGLTTITPRNVKNP